MDDLIKGNHTHSFGKGDMQSPKKRQQNFSAKGARTGSYSSILLIMRPNTMMELVAIIMINSKSIEC